MRILHIISSLHTGGAEAMLYKLAREMDREQFTFAVVSLWDEGRFGPHLEALGIPVTCLHLDRWSNRVSALPVLRRIVRDFDPDCVQGWMYHGNLAASLATYGNGRKRRLGWNMRHSLERLGDEKPTTQLVIRAGAKLSRWTDVVLYNSRTAMRQHEALGFAEKKSQFIANGFLVDEFCPDSRLREQTRRELGIPQSAEVVSLIQRWHPMKDHLGFLEAVAKVRRPGLQVILAGREVDLKNATLVQAIQTLDLESRVHLLGERQDIVELCNATDVLCTSSFRGEGFPNIIGEAMACGVPCVVTDVGDSGFVIGETGQVVPPRDSEAMAEAIDAQLNVLMERRSEIQKRCRGRIADEFALEKIVSQYAALYRGQDQGSPAGKAIHEANVQLEESHG